MGTLTDTLDLARSQLGTVESPPESNNVVYAREYGMNRNPWCAMFVTWVLERSKNSSKYRHASVAASLAWAKNNGRHTGEFRAGYVCCRINGGGWTGPGHTGIIEAVHSDGSVTSIEGNTSPGNGGSQRDGGGVWRRRRPKAYWNRQCIRIDYGPATTPPAPATPKPQPKEIDDVTPEDRKLLDELRRERSVPNLTKPAVGGANRSNSGYWLVFADGGVANYGDAKLHGSLANTKLAYPIVDILATPSGDGYWLIAADGGVFAFGDAKFLGSPAK